MLYRTLTRTAALLVVGVGLSLAPQARAEGVRLSLEQLDRVVAGALTVTAVAEAQALGPGSKTATLADTDIKVKDKRNRTVEVGKAKAYASASGEDPQTYVHTGYDAEGHLIKVKQRYKSRVKRDGTVVEKSTLRVQVITFKERPRKRSSR